MDEREQGRSGRRTGRAALRGPSLASGALLAALMFPSLARAEEPFSCELTEARGLSADDARSASELLCAELKRASAGRGSYEIGLAPLGKLVIVTVSRREKGESISVRTEGVEEIPKAAPRIAEALAHDRPLAETQRVGNLLADETLPARSKPGEAKFLAGVGYVQSPGLGATGASVSFGMMYASERFSLPVETRFGFADETEGKKLYLFSASVGGRGYFTSRDVSPYLGAGLGLLTLDASDASFSDERIGFGTYLEVGVEGLRLHRARVALALRADFPTYSLHQESYDGWDGTVTQNRTRYVWPVSIGVSVAF